MIRPTTPYARIAVVMVLAACTVLAFHVTSSVNSVTESGVNMVLPEQVGGFIGRDQPLSEGERFVLPKDTEIIKKGYMDASGNLINAQIVLSGAEKRSIHRPELCLPAQGWTINRRETIPVKLSDGSSLTVMRNTISRQIEVSPGVTRPLTGLYCYWFVGKGITTSSHVTRVFLTSWDRIVHHKNHRWAYVVVYAPVLEGFQLGGKDVGATQGMISDFISGMVPTVMKPTGDKGGELKN